ncbi:hypothetical protein [Dyella amyloliquefaciens]|uniref:hypothetical protein n=1 Tax=Dyella amyloliquefaciens TaxID=1770545 RepID=UPI00102E3F18|nr:hypothetical protein [Dyella amyloliquefaciens]
MDELEQVQQGSMWLTLHIQRYGLGADMPDVVWQFLSDADIRHKSPAYGEFQVSRLLTALAEWEVQDQRS